MAFPRRPLALLVAFAALAVAAPAAGAATTFKVVGTSDVSDSGLMRDLIKPGFEAAYPQYTLAYSAQGTGAAITIAQQGAASALIVHAASLENQFVDQGYSLEKFGRAIFWGDYVLLGPPSDPAGVMSGGGTHDIVTAFQKIATAGAAGTADFVSRANTAGTPVQERLIWALTSGIPQCPASQSSGGGSAPSNGAACATTDPTSGSFNYASWYRPTGLTQGPNVLRADTCAYRASPNDHDCYVFTDRGTFNCLQDTTTCNKPPALTTSNLKIVTRDNAATATGGPNLLVNNFHVYAVNPDKVPPNAGVDTTASKLFLDFIQSPGFQSKLKGYLGDGGDPPFVASASPAITASALPGTTPAGQPITVTGTLKNVVPGTPPLAGQPMSAGIVAGLATVPVATTQTGTDGSYSLTFTPPANGSYQITTGQIAQVENATLQPIFGDLLAPAATTPAQINVQAAIRGFGVTAGQNQVVVSGTAVPGAGHVGASVLVNARRAGSGDPFKVVGGVPLAASQGDFAFAVPFLPGTYEVQTSFQDPGQVLPGTSETKTVTVPANAPPVSPATAVGFHAVKLSRGAFRVTGGLRPGAATGSRIELLASDLGTPKKPASKPGTVKAVARAALKLGARSFTLRGKLRRGHVYLVLLRYRPGGGNPDALSTFKTVIVR